MEDSYHIDIVNKLILNEHFKKAQNYIIENNINLNSKGKSGRTPLLVAINKGDLSFITFLINNGANVNYLEAYTLPLEEAVETTFNIYDFSGGKKNIDTKIIKLLLKHGADPNLKDKDGETPIEILERYFGYDNFEEFLDYYDSTSK